MWIERFLFHDYLEKKDKEYQLSEIICIVLNYYNAETFVAIPDPDTNLSTGHTEDDDWAFTLFMKVVREPDPDELQDSINIVGESLGSFLDKYRELA